MHTAVSSLLVAMFLAASLPVSAQMRERGSSAGQRPQQQQQPRVQQGAQQGNATRGDSRQVQHSSPAVRGEQHASRSDGRATPGQHPQAGRDSDRNSHDVRNERHDGDRRFGRNDDHRGYDQHQRNAGNHGGNGNHYGWSNGNHYGWSNGNHNGGSNGNHNGWQNGRSGGQGNHYGWQGNHNGGQSSTRAFDRRYDNAQQDQRQDIRQGIRSGELTRQEASRLMGEQRRLEAQERRYMADGRLSSRERADMTQDLNRARQHIYNETHDAQERR